MRRGLVFLAVALALPLPSCAHKVGFRGPWANTTLMTEPDQAPEDSELGAASKTRRGSSTNEEGTAPGPDGEESRDVLESTDVARTMNYLNALVEESVADGNQQLCNLAFFKTHKTGSTTLAGIFYRYGVRHGLEVGRHAGLGENHFPQASQRRVDIMHLHIGTRSQLRTPWKEAVEQYKTIMRDPDNINFVTIFRDPRSHFLSYYYFFVARAMRFKPVEKFLLEPHGADDYHWNEMHNPSAGELGITTQEQLDDFVTNDLPSIKLVLLTDRFDEGLMVLRSLLGWRLIDMSYVPLKKTSSRMSEYKESGKGREYVEDHPPSFDELSIQAQNKIDEMTRMDRELYEAGKIHYQKMLAPLASQVEADLAWFRPLQQLINQYLKSNTTSLATDMYNIEASKKEFPPNAPF